MESEQTPGERLKGYIEARWGRSRGGMETLARDAGLRGRQTLYEWFAGGEPSLASLGQVAAVLGVRRVDLVAAMDGVTAPDTQKSAPAWAEALANETAMKVIGALAPADLQKAAAVLIARLEALQPPPGDSTPDPAGAEGRGVGAPPGREPG